ncbi:hypothetical protein CRAmo_0880 [Candidatus Carsonella ruddii (Anomoneura mori)]
MIFIENKYKQNCFIFSKKERKKEKSNLKYFLIKMEKNININNFVQINFKKKKKKIFFFFYYYIINNNFKIKLNNRFFLTNSFIY